MPLSGGATLYSVNIPRRMAEVVLANPHPQQRKLSRISLHINRLVNLMDSGEWNPLASDCMHFDKQGRCLQGQHRLTALIESTQPEILNQLVIVHSSDEGAMNVAQLLDQSIRTRNIADAGRMGGKLSTDEANSQLLSAVALNRLAFDFGMYKLLPVIRRANIAVDMRNEERELFDKTVELFQDIPKLRSKALVASAIECMRAANGNDRAYKFFHAVGNLQPTIDGAFNPQANLLITYLRDGKSHHKRSGEAKEREDIYRCIRYYNAYCKGEVFDKHPPYNSGGGKRPATYIPEPVAG
jgi:hypothetical protein